MFSGDGEDGNIFKRIIRTTIAESPIPLTSLDLEPDRGIVCCNGEAESFNDTTIIDPAMYSSTVLQ